MDIKQIQELIKFVSRSGVNEVAIEQENFKITIKTNQAPVYVNAAVPAPVAAQPSSSSRCSATSLGRNKVRRPRS
jgi:acetyl-CoA carboxylase biotin carboxyl carrier protein